MNCVRELCGVKNQVPQMLKDSKKMEEFSKFSSLFIQNNSTRKLSGLET